MANPSPTLKLSAMDIQWPGHLAELVPRLEELGYHRYWATEHHQGPLQSSSPTLMAALAAGLVDRMRIGTAAILLHFQSPLKVAEDFRLLELFFGDRLDLGVTSALAAEPLRTALLDGRPAPDSASYARKVEELVRLVRREPGGENEVNGAEIGPQTMGSPEETRPEFWVCGLSSKSARLAARLGVAYAFHEFMNDTSAHKVDGAAVIEEYRSSFQPNAFLEASRFNVACYGICATSEKRARALWQLPGRPSFLGTPEQCREQLLEIRERFDAPELVVQSFATDFEARLESYGLLAEALGIGDA